MDALEVKKVLDKFSKYGMHFATSLEHKHTTVEGEDVTVQGLDNLVRDTVDLGEIVDSLSELSTHINKVIMKLESKAGSYLKTLERESYGSPYGTCELKKEWRFGMPATDEDKVVLFGWMKKQGIFERYATVNSQSLNSLCKLEWEIAKKKDPLAAVDFSMPGVPPPTLNEYTKIKPLRAAKSRKKDYQNE